MKTNGPFHPISKLYALSLTITFNLGKGIAGPSETGYTGCTKGAHDMIRWLPFILVSLLWASLCLKDLLAHRYRRIWWWLGCWGLNALTWTPITITLGSSVGDISSFEWGRWHLGVDPVATG